MQVILGAGGDIGRFLAAELKKYTDKIRLVARKPQKVNADDELFPADLTDRNAVRSALQDAEVAYLVVGLPYNSAVWEKQWPVIMQNAIAACLAHQCKLVFFDNVYLYAKEAIPYMTEESRIDPPSRKGKIRAQLVQMINKAIEAKGLTALIARSADFYGPGAKNGILNILVIDNYKKGKRANWQSDATKIHSFTYTPDAARATALLGNTDSAFGQVWHLPTSPEKLTGKQFIELIAQKMGVQPKYFTLSPFVLSLAGLFSKRIKELKEMQYQNNQDYYFDTAKFDKAFPFATTSYEKGIEQILAYDYAG
ncbi:NAD-dependent dehydratase [Niabella ginsenosidivorans]|uniref:NAD-dependent dehydratase n=1 Tax=Niabella ginsenosidivorans TaxID=1176587 RepID=A0A1A9HZH9_9BACT|nr:NAD-dependent epimerase/dehydratase family protein [Niabella ginsenosidivorans]ANH80786.1 NAD-dependent dehydratase [Niabella ginsenosidivorans]